MKDIELHGRIKILISKLQEEGKDDKDIIYAIAGLANISHRTASEHYYAFKAKQTLKDLEVDFKKECEHDFSVCYSTPGGLAKECRFCQKVQFVKIENGIQSS